MKKIVFVFILVLTAPYSEGQAVNSILIAAASDLKFALDSVVAVFKKVNHGVRVDVTYGSSGKLFEQISNTAPFDLFFSADIEYPLKLKEKGIAISDVQTYGVGRIVVWSKKIDPTSLGIEALLDKSILKIAIANPTHAPYGRRAEEALKYYKIYDRVQGKLVYGENISQTAQFVTTGAADAGIIALSLAVSPTMKKENGHYYLIPETAHRTLEQGFVTLKHAEKNSLATAFNDFMLTKKAIDILTYFGFAKKK
jgi:molybdate transport system substrate-binding protein